MLVSIWIGRVVLALKGAEESGRATGEKAPKPTTLEVAVDNATEIDDPIDNVAQGMMNIGLPWATSPSPCLIPMAGTTGQTMVVPAIGGTGLHSTITGTIPTLSSDGTVAQAEVVLFTNSQGVYNAWPGTWDPPAGHQWNVKYWYEPKKAERKRNTAVESGKPAAKPATKAKTKREPVVSSDDESDAKPKKKRFKAAVKQATRMREREADAMYRVAVRIITCDVMIGRVTSVDSRATGRRNARTAPSVFLAIKQGTTPEFAQMLRRRHATTRTCSLVSSSVSHLRGTKSGRSRGDTASGTARETPTGCANGARR
ncbi:unnamed protein product [Phytophthora fragariaefolia]|uniref:Unnamed protein product n=1 Tax=Phytophthora fragariaefolia TaxID=1490495 RepID=A0A9W7D8S3_9STRA|nr:unnamed protein product [Phytophthora fragariaefolia]